MKSSTRYLLVICIGIILIKALLSLSAVTLSIYSDEYLYLKLSESVAQGSYAVHGVPSQDYPPLYPLVIAFANIANDTHIRYFLIKLINAIISTVIIIPAFLLLRKFVNEKQAIVGAVLASLHPSVFSFTPYIMSENLFYTLFLVTMLFMFNAFKTQKLSWHLATGVLIGLSFLTRTIGLLLVPLYVIAQLIIMIKVEKKEISWKVSVRNTCFALLVALIIMMPWVLYNRSFDEDKPLGAYTDETSIPNISLAPQILLWIFLYLALIIISTAVILPAAASAWWKRNITQDELVMAAILFSAMLVFIIAGANHSINSDVKSALQWILGRPIGRYIDSIAPFIIIAGYTQLMKREKKELQKPLIACTAISLIAMPILMFFSLGPVNNISLTPFEGMKRLIDGTIASSPSFITIGLAIAIIFTFAVFLYASRDKKKIILFIAAFFLITNAASYYGTYYNTKIWENHPQIQMSEWINKNIPQEKVITIDQEGCKPGDMKEDPTKLCNEKGHTSLIGVWIKNPILISKDAAHSEYIVSTQEFNLPILNSQGQIHLYQRK